MSNSYLRRIADNTDGLSTAATANTLNTDAWGKQKVAMNHSLFNGLFTYTIPNNKWLEYQNGVEQTAFSDATSVSGKLALTCGATLDDTTTLKSMRNPRYEPDRGIVYATSVILPDPTALTWRDFGLGTEESAIFFRLKEDGNLYACRQTSLLGVPQTLVEELITIPFELDLSKGFIADIQAQWRGVGNLGFFLGNPEEGASVRVHTMSFMNTSDELSVFNPAMPIFFRVTNKGEQSVLNSGCVDVSTEGGNGQNNVYGSISMPNLSGQVAITGYNVPVLAVRSKSTINGLLNTRDILAFSAVPYGDQRSFFRVWGTRDATALTLNDQTWTDYGDGHLEFIYYDMEGDGTALVGTPMTFDTAKAAVTFGARVDQDESAPTFAPVGDGKIYQTPGDILIFTMHRENAGAANAGVTYEFLEAI